MPIPPIVRFWKHVDKNGSVPTHHPELGKCWLWLGHKVKGHGQFYISRDIPKGYAHRFSFEFFVGPIPKDKEIDHICHNRACVNPSHLRLATDAENVCNQLMHKDNKHGLKGIKWSPHGKKWQARIQINKRTIHLGVFPTPEAAHEAYCKAAVRYHGEFANPGA